MSLLAVLLLCLCVLPVAAVLQEVTVKGTIAGMSQDKNTLTLANPLQYGCAYPASGDPVCSYTAMNATSLTGSVPSASAFTLFKDGDTVVATSIGGAGGEWITIAKLYNDLPSGEYVTDLVGEPSSIPTPLVGNYALDLFTTPDCNTCFGTTCTAATSTVNVLSEGNRVMVETLAPRQALFFNERNDASSVSVTFVNGEAISETCAGGERGMTGPQPISVYIVTVVPPIGFTGQPVETPTALPTIPTTVPATKAGSLPLAVIGAVGLGAALLAIRRQ
ncbi:MAG: hypothetical protein WCX22_07075 [Methanoregula sp.]